eukprot:SAG11_NODE_12739_length_687_cov_1.416667_1_plen_52_part_10
MTPLGPGSALAVLSENAAASNAFSSSRFHRLYAPAGSATGSATGSGSGSASA